MAGQGAATHPPAAPLPKALPSLQLSWISWNFSVLGERAQIRGDLIIECSPLNSWGEISKCSSCRRPGLEEISNPGELGVGGGV